MPSETKKKQYRIVPQEGYTEDEPFYLSWEVDGVNRQAFVGEVRDDILPQSVKWLLEAGYIEEVKEAAK